jgi:hypothetical protein
MRETYQSEKIREAAIMGAAYLPNYLSKKTTSDLKEACNSLKYVLFEKQHASTVQEKYFVPKKKFYPKHVQTKLNRLQKEMTLLAKEGAREFPELSNWESTDFSIQKYDDSSYITRHRDGKSNKGLVIVANIQGETIFETSNHREGPLQNRWHVKEGDVTILGAHGLNGKELGIFHAVSGALSSTPRISIGFRMR